MITDRVLPDEFIQGIEFLVDRYMEREGPRVQSGSSSSPERWRRKRGQIMHAIDDDGDILDLGCANGHLLECLIEWGEEKGIPLVPYGVDYGAPLIDLAKQRHPDHAENFCVGNVWDWQPPRRFRYVYTLYDMVPPHFFEEYVERLLTRAVEPGGRLIIGSYAWYVDVAAWMRHLGYDAKGGCYGDPECGMTLGWVDKEEDRIQNSEACPAM